MSQVQILSVFRDKYCGESPQVLWSHQDLHGIALGTSQRPQFYFLVIYPVFLFLSQLPRCPETKTEGFGVAGTKCPSPRQSQGLRLCSLLPFSLLADGLLGVSSQEPNISGHANKIGRLFLKTQNPGDPLHRLHCQPTTSSYLFRL